VEGLRIGPCSATGSARCGTVSWQATPNAKNMLDAIRQTRSLIRWPKPSPTGLYPSTGPWSARVRFTLWNVVEILAADCWFAENLLAQCLVTVSASAVLTRTHARRRT